MIWICWLKVSGSIPSCSIMRSNTDIGSHHAAVQALIAEAKGMAQASNVPWLTLCAEEYSITTVAAVSGKRMFALNNATIPRSTPPCANDGSKVSNKSPMHLPSREPIKSEGIKIPPAPPVAKHVMNANNLPNPRRSKTRTWLTPDSCPLLQESLSWNRRPNWPRPQPVSQPVSAKVTHPRSPVKSPDKAHSMISCEIFRLLLQK
mmetsp:Transcript_55622/g.104643  ORF Transcript_55622/g.104643 Transcript_55622/m.104643 type:complete len:205 (-) Transcript_55622:376-990(-)